MLQIILEKVGNLLQDTQNPNQESKKGEKYIKE